ncbi:Putative Integral membrane protein [Aspergillus calidoustus]|uniref:Putative Integral membrane protein n=1 Tax=Aspergillus calidoustus TaxID=454130 RepID=A0A0U5G2I2_ASPCI|nr:Putative Integral membrane protein [Aspergillus calidoustus]
MVNLFQRQKHDNRGVEGEDHEQQPANERTRLLPRENEGYLSPDDPAVSPYNLWSVRALRGLSSTFLAISFVWWTFLLVSLFVSAPALHTRGSGFFAFAYTTLTVGYLLFGIIFFAVPSKPMTIWGVVLAIFLFIDMIITIAVPRIRVEEGWVGIATVVWATIIAIYNIVQNRYVAWGKREEEERLTGREETRRSLREWLAVFAETLFMAVIAIISILFMITLILRARDASLKAPGQKYYVSARSYQVHLNCVGNNTSNKDTPTVLLEAGDGPVEHTLQPFIDELHQKGAITRYCYWDRPGMAWSDNAPSPFSAGMASDALSEALALADEEGPWVLVSAGIGSIYNRIFASRHLLEVEGIFLIDPLHEDYLADIAQPGRGFALWLRGILSPLGLDRIFGAIFRGRTREDRVFGRSAYQTGKYIRAKLQENLVAGSMTRSEIEAARHVQMADTPLTVVSSGVKVDGDKKWASKQEDLTGITKNLRNWDIVKDAPHEVWRTTEGRRVLEKRLREMVSEE